MTEINHYVNDTRLYYELVLSLGKGLLTKEAEGMLILVAKNFSTKFKYHKYNDDIKEDCYQASIESIFRNWKHFNPKKYTKALPYITEIAKRGHAFGFNEVSKLYKVKGGDIDKYNV